jgi:uncharacterized protein (DUF433 family)
MMQGNYRQAEAEAGTVSDYPSPIGRFKWQSATTAAEPSVISSPPVRHYEQHDYILSKTIDSTELDNQISQLIDSAIVRHNLHQSPSNMEQILRTDEDGTIRVSGTRVTLDTVIACYHQGDSPEDIHKGFDVLPLKDIRAVFLYYVEKRVEIDFYLAQREREAEIIRKQIESTYSAEQRERHQQLLQRIEAKRKQSGD